MEKVLHCLEPLHNGHLGAEESGHYKEVTIVEIGLNKSQCMDCPPRQKLNNGFCREVAIVVRLPLVEV